MSQEKEALSQEEEALGQESHQDALSHQEALRLNHKVLLYVSQEDELVALAARLSGCGLAVVPTSTAQQCVRALSDHEVSLAFVEVQARNPEGLGLVRHCHEQEEPIPVVVLSSNKELALRAEARSLGAVDYLAMPVRNIDLEMRVEQLRAWLQGAQGWVQSERELMAALHDTERLQSELNALQIQHTTTLRSLQDAESRASQAITQADSLVQVARSRGLGTPQPMVAGHTPVDSLTGLIGIEALQGHLDREYARSRRYGHVLSVLMLGMDALGPYNKKHGQDAGDRAVQLVADVLRSALRSPDIVGRHSGDTFLVLATDTDQDQGIMLGNRLRAALRLESRHASLPGLTISIGVACSKRSSISRATDLLGEAEHALAMAKSKGRDRCHAER